MDAEAGLGREISLISRQAQQICGPLVESSGKKVACQHPHFGPNDQTLMPSPHSVTDVSCHQTGKVFNKTVLSAEQTPEGAHSWRYSAHCTPCTSFLEGSSGQLIAMLTTSSQ